MLFKYFLKLNPANAGAVSFKNCSELNNKAIGTGVLLLLTTHYVLCNEKYCMCLLT